MRAVSPACTARARPYQQSIGPGPNPSRCCCRHALWFAAAVAHLRRDPAATLSCGERLLMLGREHGLKQYQAVGAIFRGWALTQTGNKEEGLAELRLYVGRYGAAAWTMLALFHAM